jgi:hypothetical protein
MALEVNLVSNDKKGMALFRKLPWDLYKQDPSWAPDLIMDLQARLNKKAHAFYEFGDADFFVAIRDGQVVGRIAAIENHRHVEYRNEKVGFWGFFECENNQETANALFDEVKKWLRQRGYPLMRGPMSCDTQDEIGMVYEGNEEMRYFIMPHNPLYYIDLCHNYGMVTAKNLMAFKLDITAPIPDNLSRLADVVIARMEKKGFIFRNLDKSSKESVVHDFKQIMAVYTESFKHNWGFVPASDRQFMDMATNMQLVAKKGLVIIIEGPKDPETGKRPPVAMAVALLDWMESTKWARKFPYFLQGPMQLINFLWRLRPAWLHFGRPTFTRAREFLAGVMPEYRGMGMDVLLYVLPYRAAKAHGVHWAELSWELEDNQAIISPIEKIGGKVYKKMRLWDCEL